MLDGDGRARFLQTLDDAIEVPGGEPLHAALAHPTEADVARGIAEHHDGEESDKDRQLAFFDALSPVTDHAENLARQDRLEGSHVLVLGLGGIGHQVAISLAAAGVGRFTLIDGDVVERSNLHRQILFTAGDVGRDKVSAAKDALQKIAPHASIETHARNIDSAADWDSHGADFVMISADRPVELVQWISDARHRGYHLMKCGYMGTLGLIGPILGPTTRGYEEIFESWGPAIRAQHPTVKAHNERTIAPTIAAGNAILGNIAALEIIKLLSGAGKVTLLEQRLLFDLADYSSAPG